MRRMKKGLGFGPALFYGYITLLFIKWMLVFDSIGKKKMVAGEGIEPPTRGFSVLCSTN